MKIISDRAPSIVYWLDNKLYFNLTNDCTNDCYFCIRKFKHGISGFNLRLATEPQSHEIIKELQKVALIKHWSEFVFCGFGEPTMRLDTLLEISRWLNQNHLKPIRINTNGHALLLHPSRDVTAELKVAGIDKLSVSLNAHNATIYNEVCRPSFENAFEKILQFIGQARGSNLTVEITAVNIPEIRIKEIEKMARDFEIGFRVRPYLPCVW